jgi:hypothetical protein
MQISRQVLGRFGEANLIEADPCHVQGDKILLRRTSLEVSEPGGWDPDPSALGLRGRHTIGLLISKFSAKWRMVAQTACAPSVVVPDLKGHEVLQPRRRHE